MKETDIHSVLNETSVSLKKLFGDNLQKVILYGSYARGDYSGESDIDVMALINLSKVELTKYRRIVSDLSSDLDLKHGVLLSIKLQDVDTFTRYAESLPFFQNVTREGVQIA